jgi:nucleotide-binding universal stress UspA family protein
MERYSLDSTSGPLEKEREMSTTGPVLIAFDGSKDAQRAIEQAGPLLGDREAVVLTVWEPLVVTLSQHALALVPGGLVPSETFDNEVELQALSLAQRGADLAREAGFTAEARWQPESSDIADCLVAVADEIDASLIVTGSRGLHGLRAMLGGVSERVVHRAHRPVLVVPGERSPVHD